MTFNYRNVVCVARREIWEVIGAKGFILMLFVPLLMLLLMGSLIPLAEKLMTKAQENQTESIKIGVVNATQDIIKNWEGELCWHKLSNEKPLFSLVPINEPGLLPEMHVENARQQVFQKKLGAFVSMKGDITATGQCEFNCTRGFNMMLTGDLSGALRRVVQIERLKQDGLDPERVQHLMRGITWNEYEITPEIVPGQGEGKRKASFDKVFGPALICIMIMFFLTFATSQRMLRGIVEEKSSRVVEILLSSLSPAELLSGKVFAYFIIGMLQFAVWVGAGILILTYQEIAVSDYLPPLYFMKFFVFLSTGYLFFAAVFAAVGAMVGDETESQQVQGIITIVIILPLMFNIVLITQPNWWPVRLLSYLPFFSPTVMAVRMVAAEIPAWEIAAVAASTVAFAILGIFLAARIFRVGILLTGKRPSLRELWKWCWYREAGTVIES